jgi:glycosyltransferase involved in cell wall biosynthesis
MLVPGDATSDHALALQDMARDLGYESEIYVQAVAEELEDRAHLLREIPASPLPHTMWLYQLSAASTLAEWLGERREPFAVNFHNITPARFYRRWEPAVAADQRWALRQAAHLAERAVLGICDSTFNATDLTGLGYDETVVAPVLVDTARFLLPADPATRDTLAARKAGGGADWLFVGRIAPHKAQHRLIETLVAYRQLYDPLARLTLIGGGLDSRYGEAIRQYVTRLELDDAVQFASQVPHRALIAHFRQADIFVSLSEHEGFCVPLLEALSATLPVVARAAGAVPETLGTAGVLLESREARDPVTVATTIHRVLVDDDLRAHLVATGADRLTRFSLPASRRAMTDAIHRSLRAAGLAA